MKFVKKLSLFLVLFMAVLVLFGCDTPGTDDPGKEPGDQPGEDLVIEIKNLKEMYEFNTGEAFSKDILLAGVQVVDQNGKSYMENVELGGFNAIPLNEDGTLKQSGTFTLRLDVKIDGNAVATEMFKVKVNYVAPITDDIIVNGDFASGTRDPFAIGANEGGTGTLTVVDEELKLTIDSVGWTAPFPRIDYVGIALEDGKYYEVQFDARASVARDIHVQLGQLFDAAPWFADCLREQQYFSLTTEMTSYSFRFQADATMADLSQVSLLFAHGTLPNGRPSHACDVYYDNIAIVEVDGLGADVSAPTIPTADIAFFVGNEINLNLAVTDDQDRNPVVTHNALEVIPNENGIATTAGEYTITVNAKDAAGNESSAQIKVVVSPAIVEGVNLLPALDPTLWEIWGESWMTIGGVKEGNGMKLTLAGDAGEAGANYYQQMKYSGLPLEEGKVYTVKVTFTSSISRKVQVLVQNDQWWNTHMDEIITLEAGVPYEFEYAFEAVAPAPVVLFGMMFGKIDGSVYPDQHTILISEASLTLGGEVSDEPVDPTPTPTDEIAFGDEAGLVASGETKWVYWNDQNWVSSNVTVTTKSLVDDVLTIQYSMTGSNWFGLQLFKMDSAIAPGDYTVSMKINASVACEITILGKVVSLVAGDNDVEIQANVKAGSATMSIQFGVNGGAVCTGGTFVISDLTYSAPQEPTEPETPVDPETPVVPGDAQPIAIDSTKTKVEGAGIHIYLADKPGLTIDDFTITVVSFESTQFAGYKDQLMGATSKVHYIAGEGWLFSTIAAGFPNDGDQVMVVNVSYVLNGVTYSQNLKFVSNAYVAE